MRSTDNVVSFCSGNHVLDEWLQCDAMRVQSNRDNDSVVYVTCDPSGNVFGYYTLSTVLIGARRAPDATHQPDPVPVALIERLAVHKDLHRQKLGSDLLINALRRITTTMRKTDVEGVLVGVSDGRSRFFYYRHGFRPSAIDAQHLIVSMIEVMMGVGNRLLRK